MNFRFEEQQMRIAERVRLLMIPLSCFIDIYEAVNISKSLVTIFFCFWIFALNYFAWMWNKDVK